MVLIYPVYFLQALEVTVWRDGIEYQQKYSRGKPLTTLASHVLPVDSKDRQGTRIRFWPDEEGFPSALPVNIFYLQNPD